MRGTNLNVGDALLVSLLADFGRVVANPVFRGRHEPAILVQGTIEGPVAHEAQDGADQRRQEASLVVMNEDCDLWTWVNHKVTSIDDRSPAVHYSLGRFLVSEGGEIISHTQVPARGPNRLLTENDFDRLPHECLVHLDSRILADIDREVHYAQTLLHRPGPHIGAIFIRREVPASRMSEQERVVEIRLRSCSR